MADLPGWAKPQQVTVNVAVPREDTGVYSPFNIEELKLAILNHSDLSSEDTNIEVSLSVYDYDPDVYSEGVDEPDPIDP